VIVSFASKDTQDVLVGGRPKGLPSDIVRGAYRKLQQLNSVSSVIELRMPPSNRLHALQGDRDGQYSISINMQYRICFRWVEIDTEHGEAHDVEIIDYH